MNINSDKFFNLENLMVENFEKAVSHVKKDLKTNKILIKLYLKHIEEMFNFLEELKKLGFKFNEKYSKILIFFHDLGKLSRDWQEYIRNIKREKVLHSGLSSFIAYIILENINYFSEWLRKEFSSFNKNFLEDVISFSTKLEEYEKKLIYLLILLHHSTLKVKTKSEIINFFSQKNILDSNNFNEWLRNILQVQMYVSNNMDIKKIDEFLNSYAAFKICDRLSAYKNEDEDEREVLKKLGITNIEKKLDEEEIKKILTEILEVKYFDNEKFKYQKEFLTKNIKILNAPTGFGKTVFSILKGISNGRCLIVLPTITSIKQFLNRVEKILNKLGYGREVIGTYFYMYNPFRYVEKGEEKREVLENYFVSKYFLKPIIITTIDQLLLTYLYIKNYYVRRFSLQKRMIIIDEVHLLNPKMLFLLLNFLKRFGKELFNDSYVFMSATFPKFLRDLVRKELKLKNSDLEMDLKNFYHKNRIKFEFLESNSYESISKKIFEILENNVSAKVLVMFNTVYYAQQFYKYLKSRIAELFGDKIKDSLYLLHSRFIYKHREKIEEKILNKLKQKDEALILISTQVVEVSLDVDFDYLITEIAPLPDIIQRFGRVYRNRENKNETINVYIFDYYESSKLIYSEDVLNKTYSILKNYVGRLLNEEELINKLNSEEYKDNFLKEYKSVNESYKKIISELNSKFFEMDIEEDSELEVLREFREDVNILILIHPHDLIEESEKSELEESFKKLKEVILSSNEDFESYYEVKLNLRQFLLPIPYYYFKATDLLEEFNSFKMLKKGFYNPEIGLDIEKIKELSKDVKDFII